MPKCICQNAVAHLQRKFSGKGVERKIIENGFPKEEEEVIS